MSESDTFTPALNVESDFSAKTRSPLRFDVPEISLTTRSTEVSGVPLQFWLMKENSPCSILFHLLVPGG